jgi:ferredoxin-NADP reductase/ferredoxin
MASVLFRNQRIELAAGETMLDAFLRRGVDVAFSCRKGTCRNCVLRAVEGQPPDASQRGLEDHLRERGYFLPCLCVPDGDLVVDAPAPEDLRLDAVVAEKTLVAPDVCRLLLDVGAEFSARAGQHVLVEHPSGALRAYSIANLPDTDYFVELHVQRVAGGQVSPWLIDEVRVGDALPLRRAHGEFTLRAHDPSRTLLLIGTGSGIAPLLAIARDAQRRGHQGDIHLFHGARQAHDLYCDAALRALAASTPRLHYHGCVSREPVSSPHHAGRASDVALTLFDDLGGFDVFIAGRAEAVRDTQARCLAAGAREVHVEAFVPGHDPRAGAHEREAPEADPALWQALREGELLHAVLVDFYAEIFADERLGPYFRGVTRQRLVEKQYSFLRSLITGTREYFGQRPRNAHHWMVVSDELFDYRLAIMDKWMRHHGLQEPWIGRWHTYENRFRADIVKAQPISRDIGGVAVVQEGFLEDTIAIGTICDACNEPIEPGERVRYHARLGTTYCRDCANR